MEGPPFKLLEAVAETMCDRVLSEESRVLAMRVHVRKPHVSLTGPLESVGGLVCGHMYARYCRLRNCVGCVLCIV